MNELLIGIIVTVTGSIINFVSVKLYNRFSETSKSFFWKDKSKLDILIRSWKKKWWNQTLGNGGENCSIKTDGRYYVDGEHSFNVIDFTYDSKRNLISFKLEAVIPGDKRIFKTTL